MTPLSDEAFLDDLYEKHQLESESESVDWFKLKKELLAWRNQAVVAANNTGHFFTEKKMKGGAIDYGYYHFCKCGYKANGEDELNGHIKWKLAELKSQSTEGEKHE